MYNIDRAKDCRRISLVTLTTQMRLSIYKYFARFDTTLKGFYGEIYAHFSWLQLWQVQRSCCMWPIIKPTTLINFLLRLVRYTEWVHRAIALYSQAIYLSTVISHCSTCRRIDAVNASMSLCQCSMLLFEKTVWHFLENFAHIAKVFELKH